VGRVARIVVVTLVVLLAGLVAQPAWSAPPLPSSMAAIGDSITRAYDVCCSLSVSGLSVNGTWLVLRWWLGVAGRAGVKVERPERSENDDLDAGEGRRRMKQ